MIPFEDRPWGRFEVLLDGNVKVKRLIVLSGMRLSDQRHRHRDERWVVVKGTATVTVNDQTRDYQPGEVVAIQRGDWHRLANNAEKNGGDTVEIIETQLGDSFEESDIERRSDDFGRVSDESG